eukprot:5780967-Amphidinium_carterae.1
MGAAAAGECCCCQSETHAMNGVTTDPVIPVAKAKSVMADVSSETLTAVSKNGHVDHGEEYEVSYFEENPLKTVSPPDPEKETSHDAATSFHVVVSVPEGAPCLTHTILKHLASLQS